MLIVLNQQFKLGI